MFPGPTELRLIGFSGIGTICCACSISAISVLQFALKTMSKRLQQESGEERVTAKSRPMMSLIARVPSNVSSLTSVSPEKRSYGNQDSWSMNAEKEERPVRPDVGSDRKTASDNYYHEQFVESSSSAGYSKWDENYAWSSQEWKTDTEMCERSVRPDVTSW